MANYRLQEYHSTGPAWRNMKGRKGKFVGVELEIEHSSGYERLLEIVPLPKGKAARPLLEEDSSLDEDFALEIVFPPYSYADMKRKDKFFGKAIDALKKGGAYRGDSCGMHMNVNTHGWPPEVIAGFAATIHLVPPKWLYRLGGRYANDYCQRRICTQVSFYGERGYHTLATVKDERIECRFPAATVDHDDISMLVDFFDVVEKIARNPEYRKRLDSILAEHHDEYVKEMEEKTKFGGWDWDDEETEFDGLTFWGGFDDVGALFEEYLDKLRSTGRIKKLKEKMLNAPRARKNSSPSAQPA